MSQPSRTVPPDTPATMIDARATLPEAPSPTRVCTVDTTWEAFVDRFVPFVYAYCRAHACDRNAAALITERSFALLYRLWYRFGQADYRLTLSDWLKVVVVQEATRYAAEGGSNAADNYGGSPEPDIVSQWTAEWAVAFQRYVFDRALCAVESEFAPEWWQLFLRSWRDSQPASVVAVESGKPADFVYKVRLRILQRVREQADHLAHSFPRVRSVERTNAHERRPT